MNVTMSIDSSDGATRVSIKGGDGAGAVFLYRSGFALGLADTYDEEDKAGPGLRIVGLGEPIQSKDINGNFYMTVPFPIESREGKW